MSFLIKVLQGYDCLFKFLKLEIFFNLLFFILIIANDEIKVADKVKKVDSKEIPRILPIIGIAKVSIVIASAVIANKIPKVNKIIVEILGLFFSFSSSFMIFFVFLCSISFCSSKCFIFVFCLYFFKFSSSISFCCSIKYVFKFSSSLSFSFSKCSILVSC